jgi:hypothetical protein
MIQANPRNFMFFSHDTLIGLLESRHKLYVQLGLIDTHVAAGRDGPPFGLSPGDPVAMGALVEAVERQIGHINRQIAQFRGPILDEAVLAAEPA